MSWPELERLVEIGKLTRELTDLIAAAEFLLVAVQKLPVPGNTEGSTGE
jgi:hypothetical protein